MDYKIYDIVWEGIKIQISHSHKTWGLIDHIEIRSIELKGTALPIADAGYKSLFVYEQNLEPYDTPASYMCAWLNQEASRPEWKAKREDKRQYSLF